MTPSDPPPNPHRVDAPHQGPDGHMSRPMLIVLDSPPAAVASERRRFRTTVVACVGCMLLVIAWASLTTFLRTPHEASPSPMQPAAPSLRISPVPLNTAPFASAIWKPSPPPAPIIFESPRPLPPTPPPPPEPLRVSLLAVELGPDGQHRALLYDSARDDVAVAAVGDTAHGSTLTQIRANGVVFADASGRSQTLLLSEAAIAHETPRPSRRRGGRAQ